MIDEDDFIECKLCGCRFFSYNDYSAHMDGFGVEGHREKFRAAHYHPYRGEW